MIGQRDRKRMRDEQGGLCALCGLPMVEGEETVDHRIPKSRGGPDNMWNLQLAHRVCNEAKGDAMPMELHAAAHEYRLRFDQAADHGALVNSAVGNDDWAALLLSAKDRLAAKHERVFPVPVNDPFEGAACSWCGEWQDDTSKPCEACANGAPPFGSPLCKPEKSS